MNTPKTHTTNYQNTFITIAKTCNLTAAVIPIIKGNKKTIANLQFYYLYNNPYLYTSDELLFLIFALRNNIANVNIAQAKTTFFSKGQPCMRASPLGKTHGWGVHFNNIAKMAIYGIETPEYHTCVNNIAIKKWAAMGTKRAY